MKPLAAALSSLGLILFGGEAVSGEAHEHGTVELRVAVEQDRVAIELRGPLESFLGFEHVPRTDNELAAASRMARALHRPETLLILPAAASCRVVDSRVDSPVTGRPTSGGPSASHKDARADLEGEHPDLTAWYDFRCAHPEKVASIRVDLFDAFPDTKVVKVEAIGPRGQSGATLSPRKRSIRF